MTGRPIDTADLRERAQLRKAAACALCNGDVLALCDALDAARAERDRMRRLIVHAVKRVDEWNCPSDLHAAMLKALGEEKQR